MERYKIYSSRAHSETFNELTRLEALYLNTFKRSIPVELYFSSEGEIRETVYSITAYVKPGQENELRWLRENANKSII